MTNDPNVNAALILLKQQFNDTYGRDIKQLQMQVNDLTRKVDELNDLSVVQKANSRYNSLLLVAVLILTLINIMAVVGLYARVF